MKLGLDAYRLPTVRDDSGVDRELFNPFARGETDPEVLELSRRIVQHDQQVHHSPLAKADLATILPGCLVGVVVMAATVLGGMSMAGPLGPLIIVAPMMAVIVPLMRRRLRRRAAESTRATLLGCGRCPACAYAAAAVPPDAGDGLIRCPECDARWRPERFTALPPLPEPGAGTADRDWESRDDAARDWLGRRALMGAALLHDARGAVRPLGEYRTRPELREAAAEIARATRTRRVWTSVGWAVLFVPVIGAQVTALRAGPSNAGGVWSFLSYMPLASASFFVILAGYRVRASWTGRTLRCAAMAAEVLLRRGRCPACLSEVPGMAAPGPAGLEPAAPVECPHCRAHWNPPKGWWATPGAGAGR